MKKYFPWIACLIFLLSFLDTTDAQRRRTRRDSRTEENQKMTMADRINYEIRLGNLGIGNGFAIAAKPSVGFKFNNTFTAGAGFRMDYEFVSNFGDDFSLFDYGPFMYGRIKFLQNYYIQGEYTFFSFDNIGNGDSRLNLDFPSIGAGYVQGRGDWRYTLELLFILSEEARTLFGNNAVEFWFVFSKNF